MAIVIAEFYCTWNEMNNARYRQYNESLALRSTCVPVPSQPTDFRGEAKSETSILLSWVAPAQTGQDNQIIGYELLYKKGDDKEEVTI